MRPVEPLVPHALSDGGVEQSIDRETLPGEVLCDAKPEVGEDIAETHRLRALAVGARAPQDNRHAPIHRHAPGCL